MPGKNSIPPFQSKLIPFRKEILEAWFARKTLKEIQTSLAEKHNIAIALSSLSAFIKRSRRRSDPHDIPPSPQGQSPAKQPVAKKKIAESLSNLTELLARDSSEVAREYDRKRSQQKSTHKFTETR